MTLPAFCPSGTRFGWTSFECIPTAFSLPSLLEDRPSPMSEPPSSTPAPTSSARTVMAVGGLLVAMAAAVSIGVAVANRTDKKDPR